MLPLATFGHLPDLVAGTLLLYSSWLLSLIFAIFFVPAAAMLWAGAQGSDHLRKDVKKADYELAVVSLPRRASKL